MKTNGSVSSLVSRVESEPEWRQKTITTEVAGMWAPATALHSYIWREQFGELASRFQRPECHLRRRTPKGTNEACAPWRPASMVLENKLNLPRKRTHDENSQTSSPPPRLHIHTAHPLFFLLLGYIFIQPIRRSSSSSATHPCSPSILLLLQ